MHRGMVVLLLLPLLAIGSLRAALATEDRMRDARLTYGRYHRGSLVLTCGLCHQAEDGGGKWNAYGEAFRAAGANAEAFPATQFLDPDRDGAVSLYELRADCHPARADDAPTPEAYHEARSLDWSLERLQLAPVFAHATRMRVTTRLLSDKQTARVERALDRALTPYERSCQFLLAKGPHPGTRGDQPLGAVYLVDAAGPSGPMQIACYLDASRTVSLLRITFHNEPPPPPPPDPVAPPAEGAGGDPSGEESEPPPADPEPPDPRETWTIHAQTPIDLRVYADEEEEPEYESWLRKCAFERTEALEAFKGWNLDNEPEWPDLLRETMESDPEHATVYAALTEAVRTALWLAEETMPRLVLDGPIGSVRREVTPVRE